MDALLSCRVVRRSVEEASEELASNPWGEGFLAERGSRVSLLKCGPRVVLKRDHRVLLKCGHCVLESERGPRILRQTEHGPHVL